MNPGFGGGTSNVMYFLVNSLNELPRPIYTWQDQQKAFSEAGIRLYWEPDSLEVSRFKEWPQICLGFLGEVLVRY